MFSLLGVVGGAVIFFVITFPGSRFFALALANYLAVYGCIFAFVADSNFVVVSSWVRGIGFALPILAFLGGAWFKRQEIREIVASEEMLNEHRFGGLFIWMVPIFAIGAVTFMLPLQTLSPIALELAFLGAMTLIALIVLFVSEEVATFLIETGLLFEGFFQRMSNLVVPAFAFFTFYSLIVIIFAAIYRILDRVGPGLHFLRSGEPAALDFADSLYFSVVTLSTVGYGDITPASQIVRVLVSIQIILGVLLLLFGFSEIRDYARDRRIRRHID